MTPDQIGGIVRAIIPAATAYVVGKGWIDAGSAADLGAAIVTIVVAVWSAYTNRPAKIA